MSLNENSSPPLLSGKDSELVAAGSHSRIYKVKTDDTLAVKWTLPNANPVHRLTEMAAATFMAGGSDSHKGLLLEANDLCYCKDGTFCYSYPFTPQGTLRDLLNQGVVFTWTQWFESAERLLKALQLFHNRSYVHGDVKPDNILIVDDKPCLADFSSCVPESAATVGKGKQGSPMYMAPECFSGRFDRRADFYSLGCVLIEMLTGEPVFIGTISELAQQHCHKPIHVPLLPFPELSASLLTFVEKDARSRYILAEHALYRLGWIRCLIEDSSPDFFSKPVRTPHA